MHILINKNETMANMIRWDAFDIIMGLDLGKVQSI